MSSGNEKATVVRSSLTMNTNQVETFIEWLRAHGCSFSKLKFDNDQEGIGSVYATDRIEPGEAFASLPFRLAITEKVARDAFPTLANHSCRMVMALFVAYERQRGDASFYAPYIRLLPSTIKVPFFYDQEDMAYLAGSGMEVVVQERKEKLLQDYQAMIKDLPEGHWQSWDDFLWGHAVLSSRSFPYTLIDPKAPSNTSEVLFPLLDAFNHKPHTKVTWVPSGDSLRFEPGAPFEAGEQIYNNYGPKSNSELLLGYGFCFEHNDHDHVSVRPNFAQDPNREIKLAILQQCGVNSSHEDAFLNYVHRDHVPESLYQLMRVLCMNSTEVAMYAQCSDIRLLDFVGFRNELAMLDTFTKLFHFRLAKLQANPVNREKATQAQKYAIMYRDGQEDVINHVLAILDKRRHRTLQVMEANKSVELPQAPFLSIAHPDYYVRIWNTPINDFTLLFNGMIALEGLLSRHPALEQAVAGCFPDIEEEQDIVMMLALIYERSRTDSPWRAFFERTSGSAMVDPEIEDLHSSLFPAISDGFPKVFSLDIFTVEALAWADKVVNTFSLDDPFMIVPM